MGDRDLLAGVVANLVENALKHSGPGTQVRVEAARDGDSVSIRVDDNGRGVPPAVLERLGTRFYRLDSRTPGFGLGLATVRAIVHLHGGSLGFADASPGLSVRIRLPAAGG
jgi:signal transduction histidine kinase